MKRFDKAMNGAYGIVESMSNEMMKEFLLHNEFNPEQLIKMNELEVRIQTMRTLFIIICRNSLFVDEKPVLESAMWTYLKEWDNL